MIRKLVLATAALIGFVAASADAQDYPDRPVRIIVPTPPGGPVDIKSGFEETR